MKILRFSPGDSVPGFDSVRLVDQKADEHLSADDGSTRCSLWWSVVPQLEGERVGVVGHFQAASVDAGTTLLQEAIDRLRAQGCSVAIGPMDGNTWRRYRVLTERGSEPTFFMELDNPEWWSVSFTEAGFQPLATYTSSLVDDLSRRDARADRAWARLQKEGVTIRNLDLSQFENDLRRIYQVSVVSFTENYLYTPISEEAFLAQYIPYRDKFRPELVFLAECEGLPVGYLFAIPDYAEALRGETIRTVIGKTLAALPGRRYGGLGTVMVGMLHERAQALGYTRLIHALQHEANSVRNMSEFFGHVIRRYTLYSHPLS